MDSNSSSSSCQHKLKVRKSRDMFKLVATGGTFDRFHKGHEALLKQAFTVGETVIIGVTTERMVEKEKKVLGRIVLPYETRVNEVRKYLSENGLLGRDIITPLNDIYGPAVLDEKLEALVCTRETIRGAKAINRQRQKSGRRKLAIIECPFITSSDRRHISSTRIRLGELDRQGWIFTKLSFGTHLPQSIRDSLAKPVGKIYLSAREALNEIKKPVFVAAVGDIVNQTMRQEGFAPDISVIDLKSRRLPIFHDKNIRIDFTVRNRAGTVSPKLIRVIQNAVRQKMLLKKKLLIKVIGEEDLAVLPLLLLLPLQSLVLYGQPPINGIKKGVVAVIVTEEKKRWVIELLKQFN